MAYAGRIANLLGFEFGKGRVFIDVEDMRAGEDFERQLDQELDDCEAMVVVIGPAWLALADESRGVGLHDPADFVRREVEHALARDIRVIPVLVGQTHMPAAEQLPKSMRALRKRHWVELTDTRFPQDLQQLVNALKELPPKPSPDSPKTPTMTLSLAPVESPELSPRPAGRYAFLWLDETFSLDKGPQQRLAVADRPKRWLGLYDVPVGQPFGLEDENGRQLAVQVFRPNVQPPRAMQIFVEPPIDVSNLDLPRLRPASFEVAFLSDRIKQMLLS